QKGARRRPRRDADKPHRAIERGYRTADLFVEVFGDDRVEARQRHADARSTDEKDGEQKDVMFHEQNADRRNAGDDDADDDKPFHELYLVFDRFSGNIGCGGQSKEGDGKQKTLDDTVKAVIVFQDARQIKQKSEQNEHDDRPDDENRNQPPFMFAKHFFYLPPMFAPFERFFSFFAFLPDEKDDEH